MREYLTKELLAKPVKIWADESNQFIRDQQMFDANNEKLKSALGSTFRSMAELVVNTMDELGESRNLYNISLWPFTIERLDGSPVPQDLLNSLKTKLSSIPNVEYSTRNT